MTIEDRFNYIGAAIDDITALCIKNGSLRVIQGKYKIFKGWALDERDDLKNDKTIPGCHPYRYLINHLCAQDLRSRTCAGTNMILDAMYQAKIDLDTYKNMSSDSEHKK